MSEQCGACLFIADDHGDNSATISCQLTPGHDGEHKEIFKRDHGPVTITWSGDERDVCCICGKKEQHLASCWECCRAICGDCLTEYTPHESKITFIIELSEHRCPDEHSEACYTEYRQLMAEQEDM
jgi:hypothetical protein